MAIMIGDELNSLGLLMNENKRVSYIKTACNKCCLESIIIKIRLNLNTIDLTVQMKLTIRSSSRNNEVANKHKKTIIDRLYKGAANKENIHTIIQSQDQIKTQ